MGSSETFGVRIEIDGVEMWNSWQFYPDAGGDWRWRVRCVRSGEIIGASTEGYRRRRDCVKNARRLGYTGPVEWGGSA